MDLLKNGGGLARIKQSLQICGLCFPLLTMVLSLQAPSDSLLLIAVRTATFTVFHVKYVFCSSHMKMNHFIQLSVSRTAAFVLTTDGVYR